MPATTSPPFPVPQPRLVDGVTWIDLTIANAAKGSGSIFVTDGAMQTVIDRVTGEPKLRVVGSTFTKEISLDEVSISGNVVSFDAGGLPPGATMNVYMGAGTLLSGGKPVGAITVPGSMAFTAPTGETPAELSASIAVEDKTLKAGADIKVTVTFSKAVTSLDLGAIAAEHARIEDLSHSSDMRTWTITLGAADSVESLASVLRLDMSKVSADGARGSGILSSPAYAVDTIVDAYVLPYLGINDEGPSYLDGVTNDNDQAMVGVLAGEPAADERIELVINGTEVEQDRISLVGEGDSWYWYYDPEPESGPTPTFKEGKNTVSVRLVKADGHSSAAVTKEIVIDTDTPDIVAKPTTPVDASQAITISFDEAMYLNEDVETVNEIEVVDEFGNTSWIAVYDSMFSPDRKSLTISAADHNLATGNSYRFSLPWGLTDLAGNQVEGEGEQIAFTTAGPFQDKAPPRLVQAYIANGSGSYKAGDVLAFHLRFTEKVIVDAGTDNVLYLDNGIATYTGSADGGKELIYKYTVKPGDDDDFLYNVDVSSTLFGHVRDEHGNIFDSVHVEYGGLTTADGYGAYVSIDTSINQPGTPQLHASSEGSAPGTGTTADSKPRLTGSGAEAGATISIFADGVKAGSATVDDDGGWDAVLGSPLSAGAHAITVSQQDRAGNVSTLSMPLALTIAASAPPPPQALAAPALEAASDTGVSDSDRITLDDQPTIGGTGPANTALKLKHNGVDLTSITTDASGKWSYTLPTLANGDHGFTVQQGETGPASPALTITVDRIKPSVGSAWDNPVINFNPNGDLVITFSEAVHIAASEGEDDMLRLVDASAIVQKIAVNDANLSADKRTLTISAADHTLQPLTSYRAYLPGTLTDIAGNGIDEYEIQFSTGNDALPGAVRAIVVGDGSYRAGETVTIRVRFNEQVEKWGESGLSLGLSNGLRAGFSGMSSDGSNDALFSFIVAPGEDASNVQINDTSQLVGRFADLSGNFLDAAHIAIGSLYNTSGYGGRIDIDTVAPGAPALPVLDADSNSGSPTDLLTKVRTPQLAGTGVEANAKIEVRENGSLLGYGYADASGNWSASVDAAHALADGLHELVAYAVDRAGNSSTASAPLALTIDAGAAALDAPRLAAGHDTGSSPTDKLTNKSNPTLVGGGAEAGAAIKILRGSDIVGAGNADGSGNWTATLFAAEGGLPDGTYTFTATQEDKAGNLSAASAALVFTVDRDPPPAPGAAVLASASDSGTVGDGITRIRTPDLSGAGALANAELVLYVDGVEVGRPLANAAGNWTYAISGTKALADGAHSIQVTQLDAAGNESSPSPALSLNVDATAAALGRPVLAAGSDSGIANDDGITNIVTPSFSGSGAEAGATVVLYAGTREIGRNTADASGNWTLTVLDADKFTSNNTYAITAKQIDKAGNTSDASSAFTLVIDTEAPGYLGASTDKSLKEFQLKFDEQITFHPNGYFNLEETTSSLFNRASGNWYRSDGAGGTDSVLNLKISLAGMYNLVMNNDAIQDAAGNIAVIGVNRWVIDLLDPLPSS